MITMSFATLLLGPLCVFNSHTPISLLHVSLCYAETTSLWYTGKSMFCFSYYSRKDNIFKYMMFYFVMYTEHSDLFSNILRKHGAEGEQQLGQAQFAQLLQLILQDLADGLAEKPVVVIQNLKVVNGSKIKKVWDYFHINFPC